MEKWVIPCNLNYYDVNGAFTEFEKINWKQSTNIKVGDKVYIYVGKPVGAIKFETIATEVDLPTQLIDDSNYIIDGTNYENHGRYMELQLIREFDDSLLTRTLLKDNGLKSVQGPCRISDDLGLYIDKRSNQYETYLLERQLDNELNDDIDHELLNILAANVDEYKPTPKRKSDPIISNNLRIYSRNRKVAINALIRAKFKCEVNENHPSFIRKKARVQYSEPHHLIPIANQGVFFYSLDVEANIVSLCSNCHNQIHYGVASEELINILYSKKKEELYSAGISIILEDLIKLY